MFICNSHLINNTFLYNTAGDRGGAVYFALSSYPEVTNCIMRNNSAPNGSMIYLTDSDLTVAYSNIEGGWEGVGNIDVNPMFRDPVGGDYHLQDSVECGDQYYSPCIDAGSPDFTDSLLDCSWGLGSELCDMGAYGGGDSVSVGISQRQPLIPESFTLSQNYPNPFNARTTIKYALPYSSFVNLDIFDPLGRKVTTLIDENQPAGYHQVTWDAADKSSGMYFYKIQAAGRSESGKMLLGI